MIGREKWFEITKKRHYDIDMAEKEPDDPVMVYIRDWFAKSEWTLQTLGERMNYPEAFARKAAHQFLKSKNPTIGLLRRFSIASGIPLSELVSEEMPSKTKKRGRKNDSQSSA